MKKSWQSILFQAVLVLLVSGTLVSVGYCAGGDASTSATDAVSIQAELKNYMIAGVDVNDSGKRINVFRDLLPDGTMEVKGRFRTSKIKVKTVEVSTDGQSTWHSAVLDTNGAFRYAFQPEAGGIYLVFVRAIADERVFNDVSASRRQVIVSGRSIRDEINNTLNAMTEAYRNKDLNSFMKYVDPNFAGDDYLLAWGLRRDFSYLSNLELRFLVGNLSLAQRGAVSVVLNYNRTATSTRDGNSYTDQGLTEMTFKPSSEGMRLYSMKQPIIFGVSYAGTISSGAMIAGQNQSILVVNKQGTVSKMTINEAIKANDAMSTVTGTVVLTSTASDYDTFSISTQTKWRSSAHSPIDGEIAVQGCPISLFLGGHMKYQLLSQDIDQVTSISEPSNTGSAAGVLISEGQTYSLQLPNGKYALAKFYNMSCSAALPTPANSTVKYRYQPSGAKSF